MWEGTMHGFCRRRGWGRSCRGWRLFLRRAIGVRLSNLVRLLLLTRMHEQLATDCGCSCEISTTFCLLRGGGGESSVMFRSQVDVARRYCDLSLDSPLDTCRNKARRTVPNFVGKNFRF